ncbi:hypothetical protein CA54_30250 [Symmachiella macrocystis]|uniref:Uncharacterized protein n=1 Tax=Symmachiella macrocystis TaxID=2527985 RepID=A0A5C6BR35_9PLAN|nr:hypothetical protein [Symmachiella macrocystis]TWU14182.1 hypothetical protein CA54_30250 [Symmachiella macrocystis]
MFQRNLTFFVLISSLTILLGCDEKAIPPDREQMAPDAVQGQQAVESKWPGKLKTGIALPQTLPNGTQIGFSVDYRFRTYTPNPQAQYVWEIRQGDGSIEQLAVQITGRMGTLSQFLPVRPEQGPFSSRISVMEEQEGQLTPLTDWTSMQ